VALGLEPATFWYPIKCFSCICYGYRSPAADKFWNWIFGAPKQAKSNTYIF